MVALFRHPLGLPIPHTAIIPRNKLRLADALGDFLVNNFLAREHLLKKLDAWNPAQQLGVFLGQPDRLLGLSRQLQGWVAESLKSLDSPLIEREVLGFVHRQLLGWNAAATAARLTRALTAPRGPQWCCDKCQNIQAEWTPICDNCGGFDTLSWREPVQAEMPLPHGAEMLPVIVGKPQAKPGDIPEADLIDAAQGSDAKDEN